MPEFINIGAASRGFCRNWVLQQFEDLVVIPQIILDLTFPRMLATTMSISTMLGHSPRIKEVEIKLLDDYSQTSPNFPRVSKALQILFMTWV